MNILVTGAKGMVGTALVNNLKNIRDGKNRTRPEIKIDNIYEYDINNMVEELDAFCSDCDFVFNLAGVNRPTDPADFKKALKQFVKNKFDDTAKESDLKIILSLLPDETEDDD